jgi:hypothetical protein
MPNINKNIIKQAGAAVANATNKAAGLYASTPEPGTIISAIQLVNGGRKIGPADVVHFTESVRNKLLSLLVSMEPIQSGSGTPSPDNVRPISGRTGLAIYVSPTPTAADATTYAVDWTFEAGTVYGGTLDVVTGLLTVDRVTDSITKDSAWYSFSTGTGNASAVVQLSDHLNVKYVDGSSSKNGAISSTGKEAQNYWVNARQNQIPNDGDMCFAYSSGGQLRFHRTDVANITDLNAFKAAFPDTQICYYLATPLTYQLTGTDIVTLVGDNYIWSDSGDVTITE